MTNIKGTNLDLTSAIKKKIGKKLKQIGKHIRTDPDNVITQVEVERTTDRNKGKVYRAEFNMTIAGEFFRSETTSDKLPRALEEAKEEMIREISKSKERKETLFRRGARQIKRMFGRSN
jgi:ribosomal subunit interface protein